MRNCTECGTPLQPGMTICPRCGKYTPEPFQTSNDMDARMVSTATTPSQMPFTSSPSMPPPTIADYDRRQAYFQQAPPQSYIPYAQTPHATSTLQPYTASNAQSSKKISKGVTLLLIIMALFMMTGGVGLIYYTAFTQPAQFRAQATATVQTIVNANAHATATVHTQATVTAQATATAKAQAQATATTLQNIYNTATNGTPTLTSSLAFQDGASWDTYNAVGGGGCAFTGNALHASIFQQHTYVPCFAQASNFSNFAFQVQMTIVKGDSGGLIFRADDANAKFYLFRIAKDGTFTLLLIKDAKTTTPLVDDTNPAVKTGGQTNLVTIIVQGATISMYVNKQFVASASDTTYTAGKIGIFADDTANATDIAFSDASVWTL